MTNQEIDGHIVEDAPYHDMSDHYCMFPECPEKCDYIVHVGVMVGFNEIYDTPETAGKMYYVVNMPNSADTLELQEIADMSDNPDISDFQVIPGISVISVEPYKVGLI